MGWDVGISDAELQMLSEGNVIGEGGVNALTDVLHIQPTPLDDGLRALSDLQPEQPPAQGIGSLKKKRFWADIVDTPQSPEALFVTFREHFNDVTPVFVEVGPEAHEESTIDEGRTITLALPMRGHVQVRVVELDERHVTLITLTGHPLAGAVRFLCEQRGAAVRFQIEVFDRAANLIDLIAMRTIGDFLQNRTWEKVVEKMIERSGGNAPRGIEHDVESMSDEEATLINTWLDDLVVERMRAENAEKIREG
ncbi:MAG: NAD-dependent epimerase/dehydratase [Gemmatimonadetes bacterium]|nr:NAD-dependent epimerase/dehydratase [Gemmatimonadota bacterium]